MSVGVDVLERGRVENTSEKFKERFLKEDEDKEKAFSVKEAFIKAVGGHYAKLVWNDLKFVRFKTGEPWLIVKGSAKKLLGVRKVKVSATDEKDYQIVVVNLM